MNRSAAFALLLAAVVLSHLPLFFADYVQDDHIAVAGNTVAASGSAGEILGSSYWEGIKGGDRSLYRPVTVATYALERAVVGSAVPAVSHAVNIALHALVCWLLFILATRCGAPPEAALLGALLFAVIPAKSEAVANVVGRAEILAALFTLAAARLALTRGSRPAAWGAAGCVLLACGSKESGVVALPIVVLAVVLYAAETQSSVTVQTSDRDGRSRTRFEALVNAAGMILPSVLAFVIFTILRTRALEAFFPAQTVPLMDNPLVGEHGVRVVATALSLMTRYARVILVPWGLANDYSGASVPIEATLFGWRPIVGILAFAAMGTLALRGRAIALFVAIACLPYLLVGNLFVPVGAILAERFLYLPLAGLCLLSALGLAHAGTWGRRAALIAVVVLAGFSIARCFEWKNDATIFAATARNNPASPRAPYWLGTLAVEAGHPGAASYFDAAIRNWPTFAAPWHDKGLLLANGGDAAGAERSFLEASRLEPSWAPPKLNLALLLHRRGDIDGALRYARKAAILDPDNPKAWAEIGHLRFESGQFRAAADAYKRAIALGRTDLAPRLAEAERR